MHLHIHEHTHTHEGGWIIKETAEEEQTAALDSEQHIKQVSVLRKSALGPSAKKSRQKEINSRHV